MNGFNIKQFVCNMLQENTWVVSDDSGECVIIDCGAYYEDERKAIVEYIDSHALKPVRLVATHGHLDHNFGNATIYSHYGLKPEVASGDSSMMEHLDVQAEKFYGMKMDCQFPPVGNILSEGDVIKFGFHELRVIETPGHSKGSVCFYCEEENVLFSGDTLFHMSIGRTDFEVGSMMQIIQSLRHLAQLPDTTKVMPGHDVCTTIGDELAHNPYMDR